MIDDASSALEVEARRGDVEAMYILGASLTRRRLDHRERRKGVSAGLHWLDRAARTGHAPSMTLLGYLYATGRGAATDLPRAKDLLSAASEAGDTRATSLLAELERIRPRRRRSTDGRTPVSQA